jgi:enterochelin esterase-like enzyme
VYTTLDSRALGADMRYAAYAPADLGPDERLPLIVFLHGGGDDEETFDRAGVGRRLDRALEAGRIPRVVVAVPDGERGFWANWADGTHQYADWVTEEVMPDVARRYHTRPCPEGCSVMGVSMGGAGTMRLVFARPDLFASAAVISAPIMDTTAMLEFADDLLINLVIPAERIWGRPSRAEVEREDPFLRWQKPEDLSVRLYLAWAAGDREGIVLGNRRLHQHLRARAIPHGFEEFAGGHDWVSWGPVIERAIAHVTPGTDASAESVPR